MTGSAEAWGPAIQVAQVWPPVAVGTEVECVKVDHAGQIAWRYPGVVIDAGAPAPWIAVEARWTVREAVIDGLRFVPGDTFIEFFSPVHPYNAFRIHAPGGELRGWYANVTYPTVIEPNGDGIRLFWRDLFLDLVQLPDGVFVIRDEDELEESGLAESDPPLHSAIVTACEELIQRARARAFPFNLP